MNFCFDQVVKFPFSTLIYGNKYIKMIIILQFFHFHGLEIGFISKWVTFYIPAAGYSLNGNQGNQIYKAYVHELMRQLRSESNLKPSFSRKNLNWWVKSICTNRLSFSLALVTLERNNCIS